MIFKVSLPGRFIIKINIIFTFIYVFAEESICSNHKEKNNIQSARISLLSVDKKELTDISTKD